MSQPEVKPDDLSSLIKQLEDELSDNADFQEMRDVVGRRDRLSRFLISRQLSVEKAKEVIVKHLQWRKENNAQKWREFVQDKDYLTSNFPHSEVLRQKGLGMLHCALQAGMSRTGEPIMIEILGAEGQTTDIGEGMEEFVEKLMEYYIGFYEKRADLLEQLSLEQSRLVSTVQIRDVSKIGFMPKAGVFSVLQRIMTMGMNNYPESASNILFISPPLIFSAIFSVIKRWLPEEVNKKFRFVAKQDLAVELLKFVSPVVIVALQDIHAGKNGDLVSAEILAGRPNAVTEKVTKEMNVLVAARDMNYIYYELGPKGYSKVTWARLNAEESPKSKILAKIYYVDPTTASSSPEKVKVVTIPIADDITTATLPDIPNLNEALLCLCLDHTSSWVQSHTFRFVVQTE